MFWQNLEHLKYFAEICLQQFADTNMKMSLFVSQFFPGEPAPDQGWCWSYWPLWLMPVCVEVEHCWEGAV